MSLTPTPEELGALQTAAIKPESIQANAQFWYYIYVGWKYYVGFLLKWRKAELLADHSLEGLPVRIYAPMQIGIIWNWSYKVWWNWCVNYRECATRLALLCCQGVLCKCIEGFCSSRCCQLLYCHHKILHRTSFLFLYDIVRGGAVKSLGEKHIKGSKGCSGGKAYKKLRWCGEARSTFNNCACFGMY
ncbi:hypothetical protein VNO80_09074 [Phaseolus coccineus]|uniref:Uncharacterized protein n=1 Tax=Phaseolus coccineus TaxID=3886 RepID=A0AAN9N654_PHACN